MEIKKDTKPLRDYVLIERRTKQAGLIITSEAKSDDMHEVIARAVGPDVNGINVGDELLITGIKSSIAAPLENHWLIKQHEIAAVVKDALDA